MTPSPAPTPGRLPRLFIGSSSESLPIATMLKERLADQAQVTTWAEPSIFKPLQFYVDSLLSIPHLFDFAVFLFEPDDLVESRGVASRTPRDNVVFELGLFMSRLGLKRAFAMTPRGRVKILSDIAGLKLLEYDEPEAAAPIRRQLRKRPAPATRARLERSLADVLDGALTGVVDDIRTLLADGIVEATGVFPDAPNVVHVGPAVMRLVRAAVDLNGAALVRHLALDMSEAWGILANELLHGGSAAKDVTWRCLMIDPDAPTIQRLASPSVSIGIARSRLESMRDFALQHGESMRRRRIAFECRLYGHEPVMHGFHVDGAALLWSACDITLEGASTDAPAWRLDGSKSPYWRFEAMNDDVFSAHPARAFKDWFDYRWSTARAAWPA